MKRIQRLLLVLVSLIFTWLSLCSVLAADTYPPPPSNSFYAEDYTGTLSREAKKHINETGYALDQKTHAQVVVVMVSSVPDGDMDSYANGLFRSRGLGDREKNNGVLLLISMQDRKARIEVGYGLEGAINDAKAGRMLDTFLIPSFKQGAYSEGVTSTYDAILRTVMKEYGLTSLDGLSNASQARETESSGFEDIIPPLGILILLVIDWTLLGGRITRFLLLLLFMGRGSGGYGRGGFGGGGGFGRGGSSGGGGAGRGW